MNTFVVVDLETTGFSPDVNEIIEIGMWKIKDGVAVAKFSELVKPRGYISREIQRITGIAPEMVADARGIEEIMPEVFDFCEDLPFLGHNLPFDYTFLKAKGNANGYDFSLGGNRLGVDTLQLSRRYFPNSSHKLAAMADLFNIKVKEGADSSFHRAAFDAYVTKLVYDRFLYLYPDIPDVINPMPIIKDEANYGRAINSGVLSFE